MKNILIAILFLTAFYACEDTFEQIVEVELPEHTPQLAVTAPVFSTDTIIEVFVSHSIKAFSNDEPKPITNANVELYKDGALLYTIPHIQDGLYTVSMPQPLGNAAAEYTLKVSADGYEAVSATQNMPAEVPIKTLHYQQDGTVDEEGYKVDEIEISFEDPRSEENYYSFKAYAIGKWADPAGDTLIYANRINLWSVNLLANDGDYELLLTDKSFNGENYTFNMYTYESLENYQELVFVLRSISKEYYFYSKAIGATYDTEDNPFVEPVNVPTNFDNGFGIFSVEAATVKRIGI